ncbi:MAG: hypothetical protein N2043_01735 [Ignavibacterium sp.]|nr:hypothetical protein [Ignavibacterium sp.]
MKMGKTNIDITLDNLLDFKIPKGTELKILSEEKSDNFSSGKCYVVESMGELNFQFKLDSRLVDVLN